MLALSPDTLFLARTITPDVDMAIAAYEVTGVDGNGHTFAQTVTTGDLLQASLVPGEWTIQVTGVNAGGTGSSMAFGLGPNADSAGYTADLPNGYYTVAIQLTDTGDVVWGVVEGARILAGEPAHQTYRLTADVNRGGLDLTLIDSLANPIDVTLSGAVAELSQGTDMTVSASTGEPVDSYQWYLQGAPLAGETGSSITLGSSLSPATYWLSLVVTTDGVVSSESVVFEVVAGITGVETRITSDPSYQTFPKVFDNYVVWTDYRNGNYDIFLYDLSTDTETQLTTDPADQSDPAIAGDRVVWIDNRNGNDDIYLYDLFTGTANPLTTDSSNHFEPAISRDRVVWQDSRNGGYDIYLYDLTSGTETQLTTDPADQMYPAIAGDRIVWMGFNKGNYDIFLYDLSTSTENQLTTDPAHQMYPAIAGDRVVWEDFRNGNWDIYLYDLSNGTETQLTTEPTIQWKPDIAGDHVVWQDLRNGNYDIYLFTLAP